MLNVFSFHSPSNREGTFRNPTGVYMTLSAFLRWDPSYAGKAFKEVYWERTFGMNSPRIERDSRPLLMRFVVPPICCRRQKPTGSSIQWMRKFSRRAAFFAG